MAAAADRGFWSLNVNSAILGVLVAVATPVGFSAKWALDASADRARELGRLESRVNALEHDRDGRAIDITAWQRDMATKVGRIAEDVAAVKAVVLRKSGELAAPYEPPG